MKTTPYPSDLEHRRRVDRAFCAALDLVGADRERFVAELPSEIAVPLASMLAAADGDWTVAPVAATGAAEAPPASIVGRRVGPYEIVRQIGAGGMSSVYLGQRADGAYTHQVAVKVVRLSGGAEAVERFRQERQILARLEHPNIARLLDGGVTETGEPYLVGEYVDGLPINEWAGQRELGVDDTLRLLDQVCDAVQAAHRQLIVHRDLKPSNILVTAAGQTAPGRVKLLDFGIAKLLDGRLDLTRSGHRYLTVQYASPEQYRGEAVSIASDVYQIGLVAYELLTGTRPYELAGVDPPEIPRLILEADPEPPSARVATRRPDRARRLRGDLDAIVGRALGKSPGERYGSVAELRLDLAHHRAGFPVQAVRPDRLYRLRKFTRRHRVGLAWALVVFAVVVAGIAAFQLRLARERDLARAESARAEQAAAEKQEVVDLLISLFEGEDPSAASRDEVTARELLERGEARIENTRNLDPGTRARMMSALAMIHLRLGRYGDAERQVRRALELLLGSTAATPEKMAKGLAQLADALSGQGRFSEARDALEDAVARLRAAGPGHERPLGAALIDLGMVLDRLGEARRAEAVGREGIALFASRPDVVDAVSATAYLDWGAITLGHGDYGTAREATRTALEHSREVWGATSTAALKALNNLAVIERQQGHGEAARRYWSEALERLEERLGPEHPMVAATLTNLANTAYDLERYEEALRYCDRALAVAAAAKGPTHPDTLRIRGNRANILAAAGRYGEARDLYLDILATLRSTYGPRHLLVGVNLNNLGEAEAALGETEAAERSFLESRDLLAEHLGADHLHVSWPILNLAKLEASRGRPTAAEPLFRRAVALRESEQGPYGVDRVEAAVAFAEFLHENDRAAEAREWIASTRPELASTDRPEASLGPWRLPADGSNETNVSNDLEHAAPWSGRRGRKR